MYNKWWQPNRIELCLMHLLLLSAIVPSVLGFPIVEVASLVANVDGAVESEVLMAELGSIGQEQCKSWVHVCTRALCGE